MQHTLKLNSTQIPTNTNTHTLNLDGLRISDIAANDNRAKSVENDVIIKPEKSTEQARAERFKRNIITSFATAFANM